VDDETTTLAESKGENGLLVLFTCNTCPWVEKWEDRYDQIARRAGQIGVGMIALNPNAALRSGDESLAAMKERAADRGYTFPYAVDADNEIADAFGATRTPEIFLFDGELTLVYHGAIDDNARDATKVEAPFVMNALKAMSEGQEIAEPDTRSIGCTIKRKRA